MEILSTLENSNKKMNYKTYSNLYIYTNLSISNNNLNIIITDKKVEDTDSNRVLQAEFTDTYIGNGRLIESVNDIIQKCIMLGIKTKCITDVSGI